MLPIAVIWMIASFCKTKSSRLVAKEGLKGERKDERKDERKGERKEGLKGERKDERKRNKKLPERCLP